MALVVADSDVLIDALHGVDPVADRVKIGLDTGTLATTTVSVFEILSGASRGGILAEVERLLAALPVLPMDEAAARAAAGIRRELERRGTPIGMADYLIAGICRSRGAALLTRNVGHFARVPDLRLDPLLASDD